jgi:ribosomal protein S18 acetylase RimI-like enzyme
MTVSIRPATAADAPALAAVFLNCWRTAYRGVVDDEIIEGLDPDEVEARWRRLVAEHRVLVAIDADRPVGMVRAGADEDDPTRGHVFSLYVDPSASGRGVGRSLLTRATQELAASRHREATLWVFADNERALRFYRAAGWRPAGATRVEPEWRAPELQLARELPQPEEELARTGEAGRDQLE